MRTAYSRDSDSQFFSDPPPRQPLASKLGYPIPVKQDLWPADRSPRVRSVFPCVLEARGDPLRDYLKLRIRKPRKHRQRKPAQAARRRFCGRAGLRRFAGRSTLRDSRSNLQTISTSNWRICAAVSIWLRAGRAWVLWGLPRNNA
jgi:hypothetical protein